MTFNRACQYGYLDQTASTRNNNNNNNNNISSMFRRTESALFGSNDSALFGQNGSGIRQDTTADIHSSFHLNMKCRRNRTVYSEHHLSCLEDYFERQKYLSTKDRILLAGRLGLTQIQVKTWYQNRRMKWKKQVSILLIRAAFLSQLFSESKDLLTSLSSLSVNENSCFNFTISFHRDNSFNCKVSIFLRQRFSEFFKRFVDFIFLADENSCSISQFIFIIITVRSVGI